MEKLSVLALDVGNKRIGVAGCDGLGLLATGLTTIQRASFQKDVEQIQYWVEERQVQRIVVGLPYLRDGTLSAQAKQIQRFAQKLSAALQLPVEYEDERLTSFEAEEQMKAQNLSPSRNKSAIDRRAAAIILQQWLERYHAEKEHL
ncbi:Holliday junction resolvase RuvX [Lusitaniella coriacea LEGE 07157]|uniref:Putative pre-16S rRNA nuclease n=1 Tax=Lusitaniella coriacea LEGE 07157 TaxID=945747 RepID=A0A8J7E109_9CYAN|nr:Holliday junction resolvase RuvX [Lusitaniella coriacea]MBE9117356.1 Holliday junction resolvase RuvX [Lusitaniella coriacea LEGE 07157]